MVWGRRVARDYVSGAIVNFYRICSGLMGGGGGVWKWEYSWLWRHEICKGRRRVMASVELSLCSATPTAHRSVNYPVQPCAKYGPGTALSIFYALLNRAINCIKQYYTTEALQNNAIISNTKNCASIRLTR